MGRKLNFVANLAEDTLAHGLLPLTSSFPTIANAFVVLDDERVVSAAHALLSALYAPYQDDNPKDSVYTDLAYVACKLAQAPNVEHGTSYLKAALSVLLSAVEQGAISSRSLEPLAGVANNPVSGDAKLTQLLIRLADL